jgi:DNA-binding transcriptional MerR regulator/methylmalonyl-CoA mutase cobalamin-binding subunit
MYTIKEASARSGVGIPLLRAWERRYAVVAPSRSSSGYRLYDDTAIERLRAMRGLIADGWSAQQAAERVRATPEVDLSSLQPTGPEVAHRETRPAGPLERSAADVLIERLVEAARRIDAAELEAALDEAFSAARFEVAADGVVMPALRAIGDAWERQEISVAGEHAASHAVLRRLAMAYEAAGNPAAERPILVGLGPGTRHELGAFAFAIAARRAGLPVLYLGPDLPSDDWTSAAVERDACAAIIGVPTRADVRRATSVIVALRSARPEMLLAVGGDEASRAARESTALELPGSLSAAVAAVRDAVASA